MSYTYIAMMGSSGHTEASKIAILNANYMAKHLENYYPILLCGENGTVAHEFIVGLRGFKNVAGIEPEDVAKRLMDYGFRGPTMSWPVPGTLVIEPTESESKAELDRFCDAVISIREEIAQIENGKAEVHNNVLKGAPHPLFLLMGDAWTKNHILGNMQPSQLLGFVLRSSGLLQGVWIMCMVTATLSAPFSQHHMLLNKHSGSHCQVFLIMLLAAMFLYETVRFSLSLYINNSLIKSFTAGDFHFPNTILIMISCFNNNCC